MISWASDARGVQWTTNARPQITPEPSDLIHGSTFHQWHWTSKFFADGLQFLEALIIDCRITHPEFLHGIEDDLRNDQPGVLLVVGRNDIPGRISGAGRVQTRLIRFYLIIPALPLAHVCEAELPVPVRLIDSVQKTFSLFVLREVEK